MPVKVIGHRGYFEIAPENTMLSFDAAHLFGFDGIELDIHMTKDKKLVVIHDEDVKRTSDSTGKIGDLTLAQIRKLNFASKFGKEFPKQKIMTYEELLKRYGNLFKIINVEIKTDIIHYDGMEKMIWDVHQKIKPKAKIIYSSFNFKSLEIMHKISKRAILGYLFVDRKDCIGKEAKIKEICTYIHPWFKSLLSKTELNFYNKLKLPMNVWSFDKRNTGDEWTDHSNKEVKKISKMKNVHAIISNSKY